MLDHRKNLIEKWKKSIIGLQVGPKTGLLSLFLRVANFGTVNSRPDVCDASETQTCKTVISEKITCKVNKIKDLDFVCVISMSLTGFMCINGNHFRCPSGRFVGIASHYCVK